jgi:cytidylate kinase
LINIAIDGPAGAGKSTIAKKIALALGFIYVDTGALYRAVGLFVMRQSKRADDAVAVMNLLPQIKIELNYAKDGQQVLLCNEDVSLFIRTQEISMAASLVSAIPEVRAFLLGLQKDIAKKNNCIMDGRDIGTVVLPQAQLKIFLTASPEERAKRRYEELRLKGASDTFENVLAEIIKRDTQDSSREIAPLKPAEDAIIIDTTGLEVNESFDKLLMLCKSKLKLV